MSFIFEPIPIAPDDPQRDVAEADQLRQLYLAAMNLSFTSRNGAIQTKDKAGNFDAQFLIFTSNGTANTEDSITHTLSRTPKAYIVIRQDKAGILYDGVTAWTTSTLSLKTSVASVTFTIMVF